MSEQKKVFSFHPLFYIFWGITLLVLILGFMSGIETDKMVRKFFSTARKRSELLLYKEFQQTPTPVALPRELLFLDSGERDGIVLRTKQIDINGEDYPYNASITNGNDGSYWLFFRYDQLPLDKRDPHARIGMARLNTQFEHIDPSFTHIDTGTVHAEDPRVFRSGETYYLVYNDLLSVAPYARSMFIGELNTANQCLTYTTSIDQHISPTEKNWVPFAFRQGEEESPFFAYQINPHKIMSLRDPMRNQMEHLTFSGTPSFSKLQWSKKWGTPRGGTPAQLIDGEYLAFFHSSFKDKKHKKVWYVMGAYTFEAKPPFRITSISRQPILFRGIYDTPHEHNGNPGVFVIFPSGFVTAEEDGRSVFHVSCGENDCATKIVTLDKEALFSSMRPITYSNETEF